MNYQICRGTMWRKKHRHEMPTWEQHDTTPTHNKIWKSTQRNRTAQQKWRVRYVSRIWHGFRVEMYVLHYMTHGTAAFMPEPYNWCPPSISALCFINFRMFSYWELFGNSVNYEDPKNRVNCPYALRNLSDLGEHDIKATWDILTELISTLKT